MLFWQFMPMRVGKEAMLNIDLSKLSFSSAVKIEHLTLLPEQGFSNENYIFSIDQEAYILRKFKLQDRDRKWEYTVQSLAYEHGLAAKPCHLDLSQGFMVCEFLEGQHKTELDRDDLSVFAEQLKVLHNLTVENKVLELKTMFKTLNSELEEAFSAIETFPKEIVLCHNDLNPKNCIFSEEGLKFIDWEFAGLNDLYFDLASVSVEFNLGTIDEAYFLASYFRMNGWEKEKLDAYKVVYKALCKQWFEDNV